VLNDTGVRDVEAYSDLMLVIQQAKGENQCLDGILNNYRDRCLDLIKLLDTFGINHVPREEDQRANRLAQQGLVMRYQVGHFGLRKSQQR
jgi:hypothetical protein